MAGGGHGGVAERDWEGSWVKWLTCNAPSQYCTIAQHNHHTASAMPALGQVDRANELAFFREFFLFQTTRTGEKIHRAVAER
jgi:hypothetical protein